jgi:phytoene desaturase
MSVESFMNAMEKKKVIIIGSGIAGIALSIRLANAGFLVTVLEKNDFAGGKLSEIRKDGYRFDAGPSLFTMPHLVDELFTLCAENPADYFSYDPVNPICRYFFASGRQVDSSSDIEVFASEMEKQLGEPARHVIKYLKDSETKWNLVSDVFIFSDFSDPKTYISGSFLKGMANVHRLGVFKTMHRHNLESFKTPEAVQLFDRYATYNGSDPFRVPSTLTVIPHVEYGIGAYLPRGGMYEIVKVLKELAERQGVDFRFSEEATRIELKNRTVAGVHTHGNFYPAELVVSNADVAPTYKYLLNDPEMFDEVTRPERSTSALVFNWGMKAEFPELDLHNIFFAENYRAEFESLFGTQTLHDDPTVYLFISSKKVPSDAPAGCENWFTMINVPSDSGQDWPALTEKARKIILKKLSERLKRDLESYIETEIVEDPLWIQSRTSAWKGSLYGSSSNSRMASFWRHPNHSRKYKNLYFAGGSVHPGGGIPMCLASARITAEIINRNHSKA